MGRYLVAAGLARLADEMVGVAVVLLVLSRTGSAALSGLVVACYTVPSIVSGPLLGAWLDRARRPVLALAGNQFLLALAAFGLVTAGDDVPALLVPAFLAGITLPMTSGGFTSLVPRLAADVPRATSYDAMLFNVAAIGGPALAGVVSTAWSPDVAVVLLGALALVGGAWTCALRVPTHADAVTSSSLTEAMRRGLRHLATTPPLLGTTVASVLSFGAVGMFAPVLPMHVATLNVDQGYTGLVWAVFEVGCVAGLLALRRHLDRWRPERVVFTAVALYGVTVAAWPLAGSFAVLVGLAAVSGVAQGPTLTSTILARQRYTPAGLLGQVSTTGASLKLGAFAGGAALGGALEARVSTTSVILLVAAVQLVAAALGSIAAKQSNPGRVTP
ncbi:MFS transporter [Actinosynnema sp. NPDC050436]|uniref:MFS transporter n=1 Tax=Actinosynnema sp. NPDC050436 TaxID=3155659 RepID=UPI0033C3909E